ncbi:MAG: phosphomannomutase/phosphoglucomutase [Candidatus Gracilibacteria bacterium]|nr:phosphomannomutase/phosphoglucomutase [Candidatus Gracilibacteria bacterium]MDD2908122.1 phosphomannomutase/phosphoglucomutase [Candidatus Gracilibacteria bacterium]
MNLEVLDKSYDIRGIFPSEINEEFYYKLGFAFAVLQKGAMTFAVGCDSRLSSDTLKKSMIEGIIDAGKNVVDLGLCSTDMVYFASGEYEKIDIGMMITASHNPKEYNGLKSCLKNAVPINMMTFGKDIKNFILKGDFKIFDSKGLYENKDISDDFVDHISTFVDSNSNFENYKVVADAGNGVAGVFMNKLSSKLKFDLIPLFFEPDGNFPNHHPSPIEPKNVIDLINKVQEEKADLGVAFDGDADRMYICDNEGMVWSGTITTAMIAKMMLAKNSGKKILYNAVCGNIVSDIINENNGIGLIEKVGHVYMKETMANDENIIFGGEHSGHYYFRNNWNADSGVIAFAVILELISKSGKQSSELRKEFEKYHSIDETNSKVISASDKLEQLKEIYKDGKQDEFDGLTVRFDNWWLNVRPSSNEPLLRLNVEANTEELLKEKSKEVLNFIRN